MEEIKNTQPTAEGEELELSDAQADRNDEIYEAAFDRDTRFASPVWSPRRTARNASMSTTANEKVEQFFGTAPIMYTTTGEKSPCTFW